MVGRLSKGRWNDRATAGIVHPWHRFRDLAPPGQESRRGKTSAGKPGPSSTAVDDDARNVYRQLHGPQLPTHTEGLDSRTLSPHPQPSPLTGVRNLTAMRYRKLRLAEVCVAEDGGWTGLGISQPSAQSHVEDLRSRQAMGLLQRRQSWSSFRRSKRSGGNTFCSPGRLRACSACSRSL